MPSLLLNLSLPSLQDLRGTWRIHPTLDNHRGKFPPAKKISRMKIQKITVQFVGEDEGDAPKGD